MKTQTQTNNASCGYSHDTATLDTNFYVVNNTYCVASKNNLKNTEFKDAVIDYYSDLFMMASNIEKVSPSKAFSQFSENTLDWDTNTLFNYSNTNID
jgi:hypothetical protein